MTHSDYEVSAQQWAAISAPLQPAVVVAGAGSGKTTLMAARVVYLVVTGQVTPDQVLGLTFTTKAAGELRGRIREALAAAGLAQGGRPRPARTARRRCSSRRSRRTTPTPPRLLTEHGLRIGHEPDTRVIADAVALPARRRG